MRQLSIGVFYITLIGIQVYQAITTPVTLTSILFIVNNAILLLHLWYGTYLFVRHLRPLRQRSNLIIILPTLGAIAVASINVQKPIFWTYAYGIAFTLVLLCYQRLYAQHTARSTRKYIHWKIKSELPIPFLFFAGSVSLLMFPGASAGIAAATLCIQVGFIALLALKKVYRLAPGETGKT